LNVGGTVTLSPNPRFEVSPERRFAGARGPPKKKRGLMLLLRGQGGHRGNLPFPGKALVQKTKK